MNDTPTMEQTSSPATPEPSATYQRNTWGGLDHFVCLLCGQETWEEATLRQHMARMHTGSMVAAPAPAREDETMGEPNEHGKPDDTPGGRPPTPPGQEGEQPGNRPDVPPGHDPDHVPPGQEPHPEHPIVLPDEDDEEEAQPKE